MLNLCKGVCIEDPHDPSRGRFDIELPCAASLTSNRAIRLFVMCLAVAILLNPPGGRCLIFAISIDSNSFITAEILLIGSTG